MLRALLTAVLICSTGQSGVSAQEQSNGVRAAIVWEIPASESEIAKRTSQFEGTVEVKGDTTDKAVPLLLVLVGTVATAHLADSLVTTYKNTTVGGALIDTTVSPIRITSDLSLPAGTIVVTTNSGVTIHDTKTTDSPADLAKQLTASLALR